MDVRYTYWRGVALAGALLGAAVVAACARSPESEPVEPLDAAVFDIAVFPPRQYSGFDGEHTFSVPLGVFRADEDLEISLSNPAAADVVPAELIEAGRDGQYFLITSRAAGELTLTARSRGKSVRATVIVQAYQSADHARGEQRYTEGEGDAPACSSCHSVQGGPDHSPSAIASATDQDIMAVIASGIDLQSKPISVAHRWSADVDTLRGLVVYLRSLPPRGYGVRP